MKKFVVLFILGISTAICAQIPSGYVQTIATVPTLANGSYGVAWTNLSSSPQLALLGCVSTFQTTVNGTFDSSGHFSTLLADTAQICPSPSTWTFTLACPATPLIVPGAFQVQVAVTGGGGTEDISSQITAALPTNICHGSGGGGGSAVWGGITGTLSSQTDLQAALNAKWPITPSLTGTATTVNPTTAPGPNEPGLTTFPDGNLMAIYGTVTPGTCYAYHNVTPCTPITVTSVSYDDGTTWQTPVTMSYPAGYTAAYQSLTTLANGTLFLSWSLQATSGGKGVPYSSIGTIANSVTNLATGTTPQESVFDGAGNVLTVNYGSNNITRYTAAGSALSSFSLPAGANGSAGITIASDATIWTSNLTSNNVSKLYADGTAGVNYSTSAAALSGIAPDASGGVWLVDYGVTGTTTPGSIMRMNGSGTVTFTSTQIAIPCDNPSSVSVDGSGNAWVTCGWDNTVVEVNSSNTLVKTVAVPMSNPRSTAFDSSGNLYVTGSATVELNPTTGLLINYLVTGSYSVAVDSSGYVWLTNYGAGNITKWNIATGAKLGSIKTGVGPVSVRIGSGGIAWVLNAGANTVSKFDTSVSVDTVSWSTPMQIPMPTSTYGWFNSSPVLQLANGNLLMPVWKEAAAPLYYDMSAGYTISTNGGSTWSTVQIIAAETGSNLGYNEAAAVQFSNGDIVMIIRWDSASEQTGVYYRSISHDNGATWSAAVPVLNAGTVGRPSLLVLPNGSLLLEGRGNAYSDTYTHIASISTDEGVTWTPPAEVSIASGIDYYEALTLEGDGATIATIQVSGVGAGATLMFSTLTPYGIALPYNTNFSKMNLSNLSITNATLTGLTNIESYAGTGTTPVATVTNQTYPATTALLGYYPAGAFGSADFGALKSSFNRYGFGWYCLNGSTNTLCSTLDSYGNFTPSGYYADAAGNVVIPGTAAAYFGSSTGTPVLASGTSGAGKYIDGASGVWTTLPGSSGLFTNGLQIQGGGSLAPVASTLQEYIAGNGSYLTANGTGTGTIGDLYGYGQSSNGSLSWEYFDCLGSSGFCTFQRGLNISGPLTIGSNTVIPSTALAYQQVNSGLHPVLVPTIPGAGVDLMTGPATSTINDCVKFADALGTLADAGASCGSGGGGTTTNALTAAATGGAAPGSTFNGSAAVTFDYHSFGAQAALTNPVTGPGSGATVGHMAVMGNTSGTSITDGGAVPSAYTLPTATSSTLGGVKPDGTTISNSSGAISVANPYNAASVAITGGTIDGTVIGGTTPAAGTFTSITATGCVGCAGAFTATAGTAPTGAAGKAIYSTDATVGYAEVNENNAGLSRVCTAANGQCGSGTVNSGTAWSPTYYAATGTAVSGTTPFTGLEYWAGSAAPAAASAAQVVAAISTTAVANATAAVTATNTAGGAVGSAPYQSAAGTTAFIASPTTTGHYFVYSWQPTGSAIDPVALDLATWFSAQTYDGTLTSSQVTTALTFTPVAPTVVSLSDLTTAAGGAFGTGAYAAAYSLPTATNIVLGGVLLGATGGANVYLGYTPANCTAGTTGSDCLTLSSGVVTVPNGGTGLATLTAHAIQVGEGTSTPAQVGPDSVTTHFLASGGSSADPAFRALASGDLPAATPTAAGAVIQVANTTFTTSTGSVSANTCNSAVQVALTGVTTSMAFIISASSDTSGITGWGSTGGLILDVWPTAGYLNYKICNQTALTIASPGAVTFNVGAR